MTTFNNKSEEKSQRCAHSRAPALRDKKRKNDAGEGKIARNFGSHPPRPHPSGPHHDTHQIRKWIDNWIGQNWIVQSRPLPIVSTLISHSETEQNWSRDEDITENIQIRSCVTVNSISDICQKWSYVFVEFADWNKFKDSFRRTSHVRTNHSISKNDSFQNQTHIRCQDVS